MIQALIPRSNAVLLHYFDERVSQNFATEAIPGYVQCLRPSAE